MARGSHSGGHESRRGACANSDELPVGEADLVSRSGRVHPARGTVQKEAQVALSRAGSSGSSEVVDQHQFVDRSVDTGVENRAAVSRGAQAKADGAKIVGHSR